jgi:hypothetical protein
VHATRTASGFVIYKLHVASERLIGVLFYLVFCTSERLHVQAA